MKTLFNKSQVKRKTNMTSKEKKKKKTLFKIFLGSDQKNGQKITPWVCSVAGLTFWLHSIIHA
jgi:hypothetical protein